MRKASGNDDFLRPLLIFGAVCVIGLAGIDNLITYLLVARGGPVAAPILVLMGVLSLVTVVVIGLIVHQLIRVRSEFAARRDLANHLNVVMAHLAAGDFDRALSYARRATFAASNSAAIDEKIDAEIFQTLARRLAKLLARGVRVEAHVQVRPSELVGIGVNPHRVIDSLLSRAAADALKAKPPETPRVLLHIGRDGPDVAIKVWNNGAHIPQDRLVNLFAADGGGQAPSGNRVGSLVVCKRLIEQSGGRIHVNSTRQHGTLFDVRLPYPGGSVDFPQND